MGTLGNPRSLLPSDFRAEDLQIRCCAGGLRTSQGPGPGWRVSPRYAAKAHRPESLERT